MDERGLQERQRFRRIEAEQVDLAAVQDRQQDRPHRPARQPRGGRLALRPVHVGVVVPAREIALQTADDAVLLSLVLVGPGTQLEAAPEYFERLSVDAEPLRQRMWVE